jgi:putative ABC transport system permease protein
MSDLKHAFTSLANSPGFTLVVLLTLALGIGVNTSMYTLVDVLLFRTVPFAEPDRLLSILGTNPQTQRDNFSFAEIDEMRAQAAGPGKAFETITAYSYWNNTLAEPGRSAERLLSLDGTVDFFTTFRSQPVLGRIYTAEEEVPGRTQVVVLSHRIWQTRFGGDRNIIGRSIRLNAEQVTVIGVMPTSFTAPLFFGPVDLFRPMTVPRHIVDDRNNRFFLAIGRLNPGVTPEQALAQLKPVAANWARDYPQTSKDRGFNLLPPHKMAMDSTSVFIIWLMFGLGAAVLLVACANIANLQLARATSNMRDLVIRSALGASRVRLIAHQLTESMVLAVGGGLLGVLVALWVNAWFGRSIWLGADASTTLALPMNGRILACAFLVSLLTGLLFGLLPAWFASRADVASALKQQTRSSTAGRAPRFMRHALIVGEVAIALALLGVAGVMIRGLDALLKREKGWDTGRVLLANIHLPEQSRYKTEDSRRLAIEKLTRRLAQMPGTEHTAVCSSAPLFGYSKDVQIHIEGQTSDDPTKLPTAGYTMITTDFFATLGIPLREGRLFPAELKADSPLVVIINETMARHFWPGQSAIGKRIGDRQDDRIVWREVIGVVADIQFALNITNPSTMLQVYKPLAHEPWGYLFLLARGPAPMSFKNEMRRVVSDLDPDVAVQEMYTVPEAADRFTHNLIVINNTLAGFALLGLVLAAVGLYGVISYLVAQRTNEFGIRIALGASRGNVLRLVLRHGMTLTVIGLLLGLGGAYALNRALAASMPRMAASDPPTLLATAIVLFAVALIATFIPARRATRLNPVDALRAE